MDTSVIVKIIIFWSVFYGTPGPVWVSVMEATRRLSAREILTFFARAFLPANLIIQVPKAIIALVFVELISRVFSDIGIWLYVAGALYILYLAYDVLQSRRLNKAFELNFSKLAAVMFLSPKMWILFPAGAVIAIQLGQGVVVNSLVFAAIMTIVGSVMFFLYATIGKIGSRFLKDNFAYLSASLLVLYAIFLVIEAVSFRVVG